MRVKDWEKEIVGKSFDIQYKSAYSDDKIYIDFTPVFQVMIKEIIELDSDLIIGYSPVEYNEINNGTIPHYTVGTHYVNETYYVKFSELALFKESSL